MNISSKKAFYIAFKGLYYAIFCFLSSLNVSWHKLNISEIMVQTLKLLSSKAALTIDFFAAVDYNYNHKQ